MSSLLYTQYIVNGELKHDVYGRRLTVKITSEFLFFSLILTYIRHTHTKKCPLLFTANTNIFNLPYKQRKTDGKSFIFCRFPFNVFKRHT